MGEAELLDINDTEAAPNYFVRVSGSRTIDTGVQEITVEKQNGVETSRRVSASYYALLVGQHWLIVKGESGTPGNADGSLEKIPPDLYERIFPTPKDREIAGLFYPFYLDATGFRYPGYWGIAVGLGYLLILIYFIRAPLHWLQDPASHPVMQRASHWGDPQSVSGDVERELENHTIFKHGSFTITDKYLVERSFFQFNVFRFNDLLWAYKHVTQTRIYGVIPAGKSYQAILVFYGGSAQIPLAEERVHEVLRAAALKAPWAVLGYTKELDDLFKKHTRDFCVAVEARRQEVQK